MFHYQFNIGDYRAHTPHLTPIEHYIYRSLIDWYYLSEQPMKDDVEQIARLLLLKSDEDIQALSKVLNEFFTLKRGAYHHSRINQEVKNYRYRHRNNKSGNGDSNDTGNETSNGSSNESSNALTTAERAAKYKRERKDMIEALHLTGVNIPKNTGMTVLRELFNKHVGNNALSNDGNDLSSNGSNEDNGSNETGNASNDGNENGNAESNVKNAAITVNRKPITDNHKPVTNTVGDRDWIDERFEEFYSLYPNKKGRGQAESTWSNVFLGKSDGKYRHRKPENPEALFAQIMEAVKQQTPSIQSAEPRYRKHPSTWLNAKAWADEVDTSQPTNSQQKPDRLAVNAQWGQVAMTDEEIAEYRSTMMPIDEYEAMQSAAAPVTEEEF